MNYSEQESEIKEPLQTEDEFLTLLAPYLGWAMRDNLEPVLHIFTDRKDIWTQNTEKAFEQYTNWAEHFGCARLYIELYEDRENDIMAHEDCLLSYGEYPM